jgi:hypothetical protein
VPAPRTRHERYVQVSVGFSPPRLQRAPPFERQKMCAGQDVRGFFPSGSAVSSIGAIFGSLGSWESWESSSRESSSRESCRVHAGHSVRACGAKCAGRISCGALLFCPGWHHLTPGGVRVHQQQQQQQQQASRVGRKHRRIRRSLGTAATPPRYNLGKKHRISGVGQRVGQRAQGLSACAARKVRPARGYSLFSTPCGRRF